MQTNKKPFSYHTRVVCTDGSTLLVLFPYAKPDFFLINDLNNNSAFYPPSILKHSLKSSYQKNQNSFKFDFYSLMKNKSN